MNYTAESLYAARATRDVTRMPGFRVAFVLSILLHAALLWKLPMHLQTPAPGDASVPLTVQLVPPPSAIPGPPPAPAPVQQVQPTPALVRPPPAAARPATPPPVALAKPAPVITVPTPEPAVNEPAPVPPQGDLAAYIEAHRRMDGKPAPAAPVEDENARASRIAAANLRLQQPAMGYDPSKSGGVFQVTRVGYDYAEFTFFGWHRDVRRDISQQVEVRKGNHATIQLAIVRKMIEIIRQYEQDEFTWNSRRLGRSLKLSARLRDSAGLEEFMLREFFDAPPRQ